jgi:hypothetical protein
MSIDLMFVNALVGILLPLLVQLIAKAHASAQVKSLVNLGLSAAASVLTPLVASSHIDWRLTGLSFLQVFVLAIATHFGLLSPVGLTGSTGLLARIFPGGVGQDTSLPTVAVAGVPVPAPVPAAPAIAVPAPVPASAPVAPPVDPAPAPAPAAVPPQG